MAEDTATHCTEAATMTCNSNMHNDVLKKQGEKSAHRNWSSAHGAAERALAAKEQQTKHHKGCHTGCQTPAGQAENTADNTQSWSTSTRNTPGAHSWYAGAHNRRNTRHEKCTPLPTAGHKTCNKQTGDCHTNTDLMTLHYARATPL
jgi:hypothetical protein